MEQVFTVQKQDNSVPDGLGGYVDDWKDVKKIKGFLDLISGSNQQYGVRNAMVEESTHILLTGYSDEIKDTMRIIDSNNREYTITYVDNPVGINHHLELYLKFVG